MQLLADTTGRPVHVPASTQIPARGAALFGAVAAGAFADIESGDRGHAARDRAQLPARLRGQGRLRRGVRDLPRAPRHASGAPRRTCSTSSSASTARRGRPPAPTACQTRRPQPRRPTGGHRDRSAPTPDRTPRNHAGALRRHGPRDHRPPGGLRRAGARPARRRRGGGVPAAGAQPRGRRGGDPRAARPGRRRDRDRDADLRPGDANGPRPAREPAAGPAREHPARALGHRGVGHGRPHLQPGNPRRPGPGKRPGADRGAVLGADRRLGVGRVRALLRVLGAGGADGDGAALDEARAARLPDERDGGHPLRRAGPASRDRSHGGQREPRRPPRQDAGGRRRRHRRRSSDATPSCSRSTRPCRRSPMPTRRAWSSPSAACSTRRATRGSPSTSSRSAGTAASSSCRCSPRRT